MDVLADTNIILRSVQRSDPQYALVRRAITILIGDGNRVCVTSQNLIEMWAVCTRTREANGLSFSPSHANLVVASVEHSVFRLPDSDEIYPEWRRLVVTYGVSGKKTHDARLVAAMLVHGVSHVLTFNDADFARFPGITVLNPTTL